MVAASRFNQPYLALRFEMGRQEKRRSIVNGAFKCIIYYLRRPKREIVLR